VSKLVLVAASISKSFRQFLEAHYTISEDFNDAQLQSQAIGIVTSTKLKMNAAFLKHCTQLQWIARLGSGMEIIDTVYAKQNGIVCYSSPQGIANAVGEHVLALLLASRRNILRATTEVQRGQWLREPNRGIELRDCTLGIIGYGNTGMATAKKMLPFVKDIVVYEKYKAIAVEEGARIKQVSLDQLYEHANIVSYHVPLNDETSNYYHSANFAQAHTLVNTSRGAVASTKAILDGFASGQLQSACLDVLDFEEQLGNDQASNLLLLQPLLNYQAIITPHIAGYSYDAIEAMCAELQSQLEKHFA
jgi:D-3-phosphoglycerate dehydrogenase / 2-oxoglutarate reductase